MVLRASPILSCREVVELITSYIEGTMGRRDRRRFELHLRQCDGCSTYIEQMRLTIEATGRLTEEDLDPQAREAFMHAFRNWREERYE